VLNLRFWTFAYLVFITTLSSKALAAELTAIPDDPSTKLYLLEEDDSVVPLLISNEKGYAIRCQDQGTEKIEKGLGFPPSKRLPRKSLDDFDIMESAYDEQPDLRCEDSQRRLVVEGKADNKRYLIHFFGDPDHKVLYEVGCQSLVDALGLTWLEATPMDKLSRSEKTRLDSFSREVINCRAGVPAGLFRDSLGKDSEGPKMVGLPGGTFRMGDINGKGHPDELPVQTVKVDSFAISRHEITVAEYQRFAKSTARKLPFGNQKADDKDRGSYPVINVSLAEATAYAAWLRKETDKHYRLPTEIEWEYVARAGTDSLYGWGNHIKPSLANYRGKNEAWDKKEAQPVGSFSHNAFMVYDMVGNVLEWTCSKYEHRYQGTEKSCLKGGKANQVVLRGGSFIHNDVRIARRYRLPSCICSGANIGFRVVRVSQ
jgi:formylglycine-generating enzyme required for sulfatase activity